jgi:hypothetical protein
MSKKNYSVCPNCQGYFITTALRKHFRNFTGKNDKKKGILVMSRKLDIEINEKKACDVLQQQVFPVLRLDDISAIIRNDEFLISYGNKICAKCRSPHLHKMIRARLRLLGRFLLGIRKLQNVCKTSTHQMRMHISRVEEMADLQTGKMTWTIFSEAIRCRQARNICQYYSRNKKCVHQNCKFLQVDDTGDFFLTCNICRLKLLCGMEILLVLSCGHYLCRTCWDMHVKSCYDKPSCPTC